jgi:hypothetical protein
LAGRFWLADSVQADRFDVGWLVGRFDADWLTDRFNVAGRFYAGWFAGSGSGSGSVGSKNDHVRSLHL